MDLLINIFHIALYQPLFNALILLYQYLPGQDFGIAVIVLTVLIKVLFYPLGSKAIKAQKALSEFQPKIKEIQEKYKNDKEKQARTMIEFYKKEKINPFSGCLPLLAQLPILIGLFQVFWRGFGEEQMIYLYSFVSHPGQINLTFFGMLDLATSSIPLAFLTGIAQFAQTKMATLHLSVKGGGQAPKKKGPPDFSQMMQKQMLYFFPIFTVFILWRLPAVIALYWLITILFSIGQQYFILNVHLSKENKILKSR